MPLVGEAEQETLIAKAVHHMKFESELQQPLPGLFNTTFQSIKQDPHEMKKRFAQMCRKGVKEIVR